MASTIPEAGAPGQAQARSRLAAPPGELPGHAVIEGLSPVIDCGRYRVKRCVGDSLRVGATIFRDGHDSLRALVRYRGPADREWREAPLARVDASAGGDRWSGELTVDGAGRWRWQVAAYTDPLETWREELVRKLAAGQSEISSELAEGAMLLAEIRGRAQQPERELLAGALELIGDARADPRARSAAALDPALLEAARRYPDRRDETRSALVEVDVERERARFGSWYELFPRSWGGFAGVRARLPRFAELGFDVLYLPPIHPIGVTAARAATTLPRPPLAIRAARGRSAGQREGTARCTPSSARSREFDLLVNEARGHDIEIALDFALQCSADHPWLQEHPEWFRRRPDGTLKYAENPPKRYMDIYNFDFDSAAWRSLWEALREVMLFWIEHGVSIFRVDNPHTKPLAFWEWLIESVRTVAPETVFLSEAFTRSAMMRALAKAGFSQSYTYFTWKNSACRAARVHGRADAARRRSDYLRPNLFVNTPDILTDYLQHGGPGAFAVRLLLAAHALAQLRHLLGLRELRGSPAAPRLRGVPGLGEVRAQVARARRPAARHGRTAEQGAARAPRAAGVRQPRLPAGRERRAARLRPAGPRRDADRGREHRPPRGPGGDRDPPGASSGWRPRSNFNDLLDGNRYPWRLGRNYVRLDPTERAGHLMLATGT